MIHTARFSPPGRYPTWFTRTTGRSSTPLTDADRNAAPLPRTPPTRNLPQSHSAPPLGSHPTSCTLSACAASRFSRRCVWHPDSIGDLTGPRLVRGETARCRRAALVRPKAWRSGNSSASNRPPPRSSGRATFTASGTPRTHATHVGWRLAVQRVLDPPLPPPRPPRASVMVRRCSPRAPGSALPDRSGDLMRRVSLGDQGLPVPGRSPCPAASFAVAG